ncbi:MAG: RNA polymerase sigma-70 factor [Chloroflexota bacterium]|nr:RNA polymerase sigma-70 factor [Chloroflexota bacterium]
MDEAEPIVAHRPLLFAIAYRMLGSVTDAEDVLQEAFLRWHRARVDDTAVDSPKAWLSTVVTRLCLDQLRSARVRREQYVGPWLPEPLAVETEPDVADAAVLSDTISTAFLLLLETLSPKERAVFLLHDVFAYGYAEIGGIVGESEVYCRQLARRARAHLADRRPRFAASPADQQRLAETFLRAATDGALPALVATLAEDVVYRADGGPNAQAARRPVHGADKVARLLIGLTQKAPADLVSTVETINGGPGIVSRVAGRAVAVVTFAADEAIREIQFVVNPAKLRGVDPPARGIRGAPAAPPDALASTSDAQGRAAGA